MWLFSWLFWWNTESWWSINSYENKIFDISFIKNYDLFDFSYETFYLEKRNGKSRKIQAPNNQLKQVQKEILEKLERNYIMPGFVTAFRKRYSIKYNAKKHINKKIVISMDIKDFFPSITEEKIKNRFKYYKFDEQDIEKFIKYTITDGSLPQWAPTSPFISNFVFLSIDYAIIKILEKYDDNVSYTRYADDITFSSDNTEIKNAIRIIETIVMNHWFTINKEKTKVYRNHTKQMVTWLVVNQKVAYPRNKYMILRAKINNFLKNKEWNINKIKWHLAFLRSVDYKKYKKLKKYYSKKFSNIDLLFK